MKKKRSTKQTMKQVVGQDFDPDKIKEVDIDKVRPSDYSRPDPPDVTPKPEKPTKIVDRIVFNVKKVKRVLIDMVRPNTWNPKDVDTSEYARVRASIAQKGLKKPVVVRENDGYEIIDGEQRWRACKELGYTKILIYNEGSDISDQEAQELTIAYQQQVPFNYIDLAGLFKDMQEKYGQLNVPYSDIEIESLVNTLKFNLDAFEGMELQDEDGNIMREEYMALTADIPARSWPLVESEFTRIGDILEIKAGIGERLRKGLIIECICLITAQLDYDEIRQRRYERGQE